MKWERWHHGIWTQVQRERSKESLPSQTSEKSINFWVIRLTPKRVLFTIVRTSPSLSVFLWTRWDSDLSPRTLKKGTSSFLRKWYAIRYDLFNRRAKRCFFFIMLLVHSLIEETMPKFHSLFQEGNIAVFYDQLKLVSSLYWTRDSDSLKGLDSPWHVDELCGLERNDEKPEKKCTMLVSIKSDRIKLSSISSERMKLPFIKFDKIKLSWIKSDRIKLPFIKSDRIKSQTRVPREVPTTDSAIVVFNFLPWEK